jgi:hypothetical protein
MIGEVDNARGVLFVDAVEPLRLIDPTAAARLLNLRRHTLACYRNLGEGPVYYKFGRWIRYAEADLRHWLDGTHSIEPLWPRQTVELTRVTALVDTATAACFLTISVDCLKNYRKAGDGPLVRRCGRRVHYSVAGLVDWAQAQRRPSIPVRGDAIQQR